jgi:hypothetical protein
MQKFVGFVFLFSSFFSGCVSGIKVTDVSQSLDEVRAAIQTVAVEYKWVSANRRVFESRYFARDSKREFDPYKSRERLYARFTIAGDRRPYQILIEVLVERKKGSAYEKVGDAPEIAEKLAEELALALTKGREDRNAIDSFRAF